MKVLLDLNVVLDVILNRQPFLADSLAVWNAQQSGEFEGFLASTEFTNLFYIVERIAGNSAARTAVSIVHFFRVAFRSAKAAYSQLSRSERRHLFSARC